MNKLFAAVTAPAPRSAANGVVSADAVNRCFVRDLVLDALVGVYEHERAQPQRVRLSLDLTLAGPGLSGEDAAATAREVIAEGHVTLLETMAERIAERCLSDARVRRAVVRVEKLDVFPDAVVGVEIERSRL